MQSFIVIHQDKNKREEYLTASLAKDAIGTFDTIRVLGETSLGIEEMRNMQKSVFLTPVKGSKKAIILEDAQTLTIEAQNALLKILEEPPAHVLFFLSTTSTDSLLPTILSRCSLVKLQEDSQDLTPEQITVLEEDVQLLLSSSIAIRLSLAEKIANQKDLISVWLSQAIHYLRSKMLEDVDVNAHLTGSLQNLQDAYRLITTTNTNPRMVLEHTFLTC